MLSRTLVRPSRSLLLHSGLPRNAPGSLFVRGYAAKQENHKISIAHLGIGSELYIQPASLPAPTSVENIKLIFRAVGRRFISLVQMTMMVGQFRWRSKLKPRFLEWKNSALETYVAVNKAFAKQNLAPVHDRMSVWVEQSLQARIDSIPSSTKMDWKIVKFTSTPKVMSIQPMMLPNEPMTMLQIVYRIQSLQKLTKISRGQAKPQVAERNVTDYIAFTVDASKTPSPVIMAGSVFETDLRDPRPVATDGNPNDILNSMKLKGDIFRQPPARRH